MDAEPPSSTVPNPLVVMQPGERIVCEITRHPFGLVTMYIMTGVSLILAFALVLFLAPQYLPDSNRSQAMTALLGILGFITVLVLLMLYITTKVYWGNRWVVTTDSITQVTQRGLFNKQTSQLSMANIEDITVEQNGLLAHMFDFGVLKAQSAGEQARFSFMYCPHPNRFAQQILAAREAFEQNRENTK